MAQTVVADLLPEYHLIFNLENHFSIPAGECQINCAAQGEYLIALADS